MKDITFTVKSKNVVRENDRFWAACGIDSLYPLVFTKQGEYLMQRMQKYGTCHYMRNHHTLSSLAKDGFENAGGNVYFEDENGNPVYSFETINKVFHRYLEYGIKR